MREPLSLDVYLNAGHREILQPGATDAGPVDLQQFKGEGTLIDQALNGIYQQLKSDLTSWRANTSIHQRRQVRSQNLVLTPEEREALERSITHTADIITLADARLRLNLDATIRFINTAFRVPHYLEITRGGLIDCRDLPDYDVINPTFAHEQFSPQVRKAFHNNAKQLIQTPGPDGSSQLTLLGETIRALAIVTRVLYPTSSPIETPSAVTS